MNTITNNKKSLTTLLKAVCRRNPTCPFSYHYFRIVNFFNSKILANKYGEGYTSEVVVGKCTFWTSPKDQPGCAHLCVAVS